MHIPALMRLLSTMANKAGLRIEPLCALDAIVATESWEILRRLRILVLG